MQGCGNITKNLLVQGQVNWKYSLVLVKRYLSNNDQSFDQKQNGQIKTFSNYMYDVSMEQEEKWEKHSIK